MAVAKISIAIDKEKLRLARAAAKSEGLSLSAFFARGLDRQLDEHERIAAARALADEWGADATPTAEDRAELRRHMQRPHRRRAHVA